MKPHFNPNEPWRDQVYYGDDRVGNSILFWSQPEYCYRALFSPVLILKPSISFNRIDCKEQYLAFELEHGERLAAFVDSLVINIHGIMVIYWNGDFQDIRMYFRLNDLEWLNGQVRYLEGVGDSALDPRMRSA